MADPPDRGALAGAGRHAARDDHRPYRGVARNRQRQAPPGAGAGVAASARRNVGLHQRLPASPEPLRLVGRSPAPGSESLEAHDHAERAIRAFAVVVAEKGYARTTVDEVVARAGMSATTFYDNFAGKEDILVAAIDSAGAQTVAAAVPPFERAADWPHGLRAAYSAVFNFLASRPALARLVMSEIYAAGPTAVERRVEAMRPLRAMIEQGLERAPETPRIAPELIAGGISTLAYRAIRDRGPGALPALTPLATYITLAPFLGAEEACKVANGTGRRERLLPGAANTLIR